jgi:hypothetical protein
MISFKKTVVFFALCLSLILSSCASQRVEPNSQPPKKVATTEETQPQECTDIRINSGWFIEKNGYCYFEKQRAIGDLRLEETNIRNPNLEQYAAQQKTNKQDDEWDICFGPILPADRDWYVACSDCMCCVVINGKMHCMSDNNVAAPVMSR